MHAIYDSCVGRGKVDIETRAAVSTPRVHVVRDCVRVHGFFGVAIRPRFVAAFVVRVSGHVPDRVRQRASVGWRRPSCLIHTSVRSVPNSKKDSSSIMWYAHIRIMTLYASMGKNVSTYYGRDWHYMLEEQARGHEHAFSCDHIMKSLPSIPMFTIFNQASPEQLLTYCPKITFSHTLTVFDSRLSTLFYVANNLATPPFQTTPFPLYKTNLSMLPMHQKTTRLHASIGTVSHNSCRRRLYNVLRQSNNTFTHEENNDWLETIRRSEFNLMCSGTFPATFMIYETILAATLPIFVISGSGLLLGVNAENVIQKKKKQKTLYKCQLLCHDAVCRHWC